MAFGEGKYANRNPLMELHEGEPYFFIRGKDALAPAAIEAYAGLLEAAACALLIEVEKLPATAPTTALVERITSLQQGATDVRAFSAKIATWQAGPGRAFLKLPD